MELVNHISDDDLERYYLGMVKEEAELASLEEHLLACSTCVERAEATQDYVDALRMALVTIRRTEDVLADRTRRLSQKSLRNGNAEPRLARPFSSVIETMPGNETMLESTVGRKTNSDTGDPPGVERKDHELKQLPEDPHSTYRMAKDWWVSLSLSRRVFFSSGVITFMLSYEYVHDFGVKHPLLALVGVAAMILSAARS